MLDEPNSNLDAAGEQALTETLQRAKKRGVTAVVVTLRPALLNSVDKVLVLMAAAPRRSDHPTSSAPRGTQAGTRRAGKQSAEEGAKSRGRSRPTEKRFGT